MKPKSTKTALLMSFTSLLLCFAMLIGCTFAWFTDSVTSGVNKIVAGNLDIEVSYNDEGTWKSIEGFDSLFDKDALWEPGHTEYVTLKVENKGTLAFKYQLAVTPVSEVGGINVDDQQFKLSDYLVFATTEPDDDVPSYADRAAARTAAGDVKKLNQAGLSKSSKLLPKAADAVEYPAEYITLVVYMPEDVGNEANYKTGTTAPYIDLGITVLATQLQHEEDSFGNDYDKDDSAINNSYAVGMPAISAETPVAETGDTVLTANTQAYGSVTSTTIATATVPAGTKAGDTVLTSTDKLQLTVTPSADADKGITVETGSSSSTFDVSLVKIVETGGNVKVEAAAGNPIKVELNIGVVDLQEFYHHGNKLTKVGTLDAVDALGEYFYSVETGKVTFMTDSFSPFTSVYKFAGGLGNEDHPYLIANAEHLDAVRDSMDACFMLIADIDATDRDWIPLGYGYYKELGGGTHQLVLSGSKYFEGVFDGNNHVIKYKYDSATANYAPESGSFKDVSLFGVIWPGDVYDLTLDVDINITEKGVAASGIAYQAFGSFENITVNGSIKATSSSAGLVYAASYSSFENCTNNADIDVTYMYTNAEKTGDAYQLVGGIAGDVASMSGYDAEFINCKNTGNLTNKTVTDRQPRSIMGAMYAQAINSTVRPVTLENCSNTGVLTGYEASNVSPNAYPYPMFEGVKNSGGTTYTGTPNAFKQLVGGYSSAGLVVDGVVYDKNTNLDALSVSGKMVMFKPGTAE